MSENGVCLKERERIEWLLWLLMSFDVHRYLMSCADGRWDGAEKAQRHQNLCRMYIASVKGCEVDQALMLHYDYWNAIHEKTQELTSCMDDRIGFPLHGRPDYDKLAPLFFDEFIRLADSVNPTTEATVDWSGGEVKEKAK